MHTQHARWLIILLLSTLLTACGDSSGGTDVSSGSTRGGSTSGGTISDMTDASGGSTTGGATTGGIASGGAATGGALTGGMATGGMATGGAATGGMATGGAATGGVATGGMATGGMATGGAATGGTPTGGAPTGGTTSMPVRPSAANQVVISEFMAKPNVVTDMRGEWVEFHNPSANTYDLDGCQLTGDGGQRVTLFGAVVLPPGGFATVSPGNDPGFMPGVVYSPSNFTLNHMGDDSIRLECDGTVIDEVVWGMGSTFPMPLPEGAAMSLDPSGYNMPDTVNNNDGMNWCPATGSYNGDLGTPNAPNPACP